MTRVSIGVLLVAAVCYLPPPVSAQAPPAIDEVDEARDQHHAEAVTGEDERTRVDATDLIRRLFGHSATDDEPQPRRAVTTAVVPVIGAQPHVGFFAGAGAAVEFPLGPLERTPFSSLNASVTYSTEKQLGVSFSANVYGADNNWRVEGRNAFNQKNANNVALGTSSVASEALTLDYQSTAIADTFYMRTWDRLYVGAGVTYARQREIVPVVGGSGRSPFASYSTQHGFDPDAQTSAGATLGLVFDGRDNANDAVHGWYGAAAFHPYFKGFLGGDSTWQELFADIRTYRALTGDHRHKLAFWSFGDFVTGGPAPYFSLPTSAGDPDGRSNRGYAEGRFRGERMLYGEIEYRGLVTRNGFVGVVSFANIATLSNQETGERLFHSAAVGGGGGVRLLLSKRSRTNICFDVGFGRSGSRGVYLGLRDAF